MKTKSDYEFSNMKIKFPKASFTNIINHLYPDFNFQNWEKSKEYKIFLAGRNDAIKEIRAELEYKLKPIYE